MCFYAVLIERVLCNLVENAAKYTSAGSCITLAAEVQTNVVQVCVSDNGPGVPVGREEAIFEKFTRGECESAKPGVGLSLSIYRAIVQAHGGKIEVRPSRGGGAAFAFTLPLGVPPKCRRWTIKEQVKHEIANNLAAAQFPWLSLNCLRC